MARSRTAVAEPEVEPGAEADEPTEAAPVRTRRAAIVKELNFDDALGDDELPTAAEKPSPVAQITRTLTKLRTATGYGEVPVDSDGYLKFVTVAQHESGFGAGGTLRELRKHPERCPDGFEAWEFRKVPGVHDDGTVFSQLRARYVGIAPTDEPDAE